MIFIIPTHHFLLYPASAGFCFPDGSVVKNPPPSAEDSRDIGLTPESGRSPRGGNDNPLQYCCLGNLMDRRAWRVTVCGVSRSQTGLSKDARVLGFSASMCAISRLQAGPGPSLTSSVTNSGPLPHSGPQGPRLWNGAESILPTQGYCEN